MLALSLNMNSSPRQDEVEDAQDRLFELTKQNRKLRFEVTQLTERNTQLSIKIGLVDAMYEQLKAKHLQEVEERKRMQLGKQALEKQLHQLRDRHSSVSSQPRMVEQDKASPEGDWLRQVSRQLLELLKTHGMRGHEATPIQFGQRQSKRIAEDINRMIKEVGSTLAGSKQSVRQANQTATKQSALLKSLKQDNEQLKLAVSDSEQVREQLDKVYQDKAQLKAQLNVTAISMKLLKQRTEQLDRRNQHYEKQQVRQSQLVSTSSPQANDQQFAIQLLLLEKTSLYQLIQRYPTMLYRLIQTSNSKQLAVKLLEIFNIQLEELDQEKRRLQLQYQLEDIERAYKLACDRNQPQKKLVATRKEIQRLRSQLAATLSDIASTNTKLDGKFELFMVWNSQNQKVRNYCWDVERKLAEANSSRTPMELQQYRTSAELLRNKPQEPSERKIQAVPASQHKSQRIYFYQSSGQQPQPPLNKDRQHLQSLFMETRNRLQRMQQSTQ